MNRFCGRHRPLLLITASLVLASSALAQHIDEEIIVTATPGNLSAAEIAQAVTVVAGDELVRVRAANIGETLESQLGMSASYFGTGASRPIIRGLAGARVRTMEDGIEALDVSTVSVDHAVGIDPLAALQVEIFRGPTTLLYGSGAVGGVVNTVTNRIPDFAPDDGLAGAFELRGDTAADERALAVTLDGGGNSFAWHFDGSTRDTGDLEIPGFAELQPGPGETPVAGRLENSDLELTSFSFGGSLLGDASVLGVAVSGFETGYGIPGHEDEDELVRIDLDQSRVDLKGRWFDVGQALDAINLRVGVNDYEHVELEGDEVGTRFENDAYEARLEFLHASIGRWSGAFGLQLSERDLEAIGEEAFVPPVETTAYGAFLVERFESDAWSLELGVRHEYQEQRPTGAAAIDDSATSLSAAAVRTLDNGYSLAMNLASAERLPTAEELFADGPHLATRSVELGSASLGNETSEHVDIGLRKTNGELNWSVTAFVTDYADFIYLSDTGAVDPDEDLPIFQWSQRDAEFAGVEAEVFAPVAQLGDGELDLRVFADFVRAELAGGEKVPRIPPLRYGARLSYHAERFSAGIEATRYDRQDDVAPFETPTGGYTLVSADFDWSLRTGTDFDVSLFLRGSNLLDEDARRHSSVVKDFVPLPGRNFAFGVRVSHR
ncbi:MAG TPA: TonB-dependent receptor [Gammaproteobacteria bacterium]